MTKILTTLAAAIFCTACGGNPTAPTPISAPAPPVAVPAPAPATPAIVRVTVAGVASNATTGRPIGGATATIAGISGATDGNGYFSISGIAVGTVTLTVAAPGHNTLSETFAVSGDTRRDVRVVPFWTATGSGNTVFDMPTSVRRVRIIGTYAASGSNFIVRVGGRLVVNEIIGTGRTGGPRYEGVHAVTGGQVEITNSRDVQWSFVQEQ